MGWLLRLRSCPVRWQITALAIGPVLVVCVLAVITEPALPHVQAAFADRIDLVKDNPYPASMAAQIELVVAQLRVSETPEQAAAILDAVVKTGLRVELAAAGDLAGPAPTDLVRGDIRRLVQRELSPGLATALLDRTADGALSDVLLVGLDEERALAFALEPDLSLAGLDDSEVDFILKMIVLVAPLLLLLFYAGRMITAPLSRFAAAAQALSPDEGPDRPFKEQGAGEIRMLARALNDMRSRIRRMIDDRTRMLRAISHDLRTPLTRLRLRAERSTQPELREAMLSDIAGINDMIEETLTYLSREVSTERLVRVDLASLLQTVCADFTDIGFAVAYQGRERFAYDCKPRALARAVTNLVDNGTKFATEVTVRLAVAAGGAVRIEVADDGPGLPAELRAKVLEPFFKGNPARTATDRSGFGLGLSIVDDVVRGHGGSITLLDRAPQGLIVRLDLPAETGRPGDGGAGAGRA